MAGVFKFERDFYCIVESNAAQTLSVNVVRTEDGTAATDIGKLTKQTRFSEFGIQLL